MHGTQHNMNKQRFNFSDWWQYDAAIWQRTLVCLFALPFLIIFFPLIMVSIAIDTAVKS